MKGKLLAIFFSLCLISASIGSQAYAGSPKMDDNLYANEVPVSAGATAALIDVDSGRILYGKDMNKQMRIASLTKILTAILAIESGKMDDIVTVSSNAAGKEGSSIYLAAGEKLKLSDLVYAIMLRSGNDAATAIAEHVSGSVDKFADLMNQKVKQLGLTDSHFVNPHGLDNDQHFSTAHDMAVITAYALKNPTFRQIVATKNYSIPWQGKEWDRSMRNKNKMLTMYGGADGVKTGYTKKAGRCLASSATKDDEQLAVIVLNDGNDWRDSASLLDYGFTKYNQSVRVKQGEPLAQIPVTNGTASTVAAAAIASYSYPTRSEEQSVQKVADLPKQLKAPIKQGQVIGHIRFMQGNQLLSDIPVNAMQSVDGTGFWWQIVKWWQSLWRHRT